MGVATVVEGTWKVLRIVTRSYDRRAGRDLLIEADAGATGAPGIVCDEAGAAPAN